MSTSRDSRIGLPPSIDSTTASSRARSWIRRATRKRYFARSRPGSLAHLGCAARAASTAAATSASPAKATSATGSSVAGLTDGTRRPSRGSTNSPPMNSP